MQDNQAEIMLKILESIDRRFEMLNTHLANVTKVLSSLDDNVRALRITSAENPVTPTPKPKLDNPNAGQPRETVKDVKVTIVDGIRRYSKNESGVIKVVFYPAEREIGNGKTLFTKLAVRQGHEQGAESADRFNEGDVLTVTGTLQRSEYNGRTQTTLWADSIVEPDPIQLVDYDAPKPPQADDTDDMPF